MDVEDVRNALKDIAERDWGKNQRPVFLSSLPKLLSEGFDIDYKLVLGDVSLKKFIEDSPLQAGYRLVMHPRQRAKLGIIPANAAYEFPDDRPSEDFLGFTNQDVDGFLRVMKSMDADELSRISLPATLFIKLLGDR
jgi:hypothetical protein